MYEDMYELSLERGPSPAYDATTMVSTTLDGSPGLDLETSDLDEERRRELRAFLMDARSRFGPGDVGLPPRSAAAYSVFAAVKSRSSSEFLSTRRVALSMKAISSSV